MPEAYLDHSVRQGQKVGKCIPFRGPLMRSANRGNPCNNRLPPASAPNRPDCRGEKDRPQTQRALRKRVLHAVARPVRRPRPPIVPRDTTSKSSPSVSHSGIGGGGRGIGAVQHPSNNPTFSQGTFSRSAAGLCPFELRRGLMQSRS